MSSSFSNPQTRLLLLFLLMLHSFVSELLVAVHGMPAAINEEEKRHNVAIASLVVNADCLLPKDRGKPCADEEQNMNGTMMKWYFDPESLRCLAFGFKGCGGNANRFDSVFDCHKNCEFIADYAHCAGGENATARKANGRHIICWHNNATLAEKCPDGYRCQMMFAYGICCDNHTYETYARNYHPSCANGAESLKIFDELNQWPIDVLGKTCADEFCPPRMECLQQELFAHCCPTPNDG